jgi:polyisoprenoid-binding protein YceI
MTTIDSTRNAVPTAWDASTARPAPVTQTAYQIDPAASRVAFAIRHRLFFVHQSTVTGRFTDVAGTITLNDDDPSTAEAMVTIDAASIDTGNAQRDTHLRTAAFFDVDQHPTLTFRSRRVAPVDPTAGRKPWSETSPCAA